jgi:uncharacterized protein
MPLEVNIRHLLRDSVRLKGRLAVKELELDLRDDMVQVSSPLEYDLEVQKLGSNLLAQGQLELALDCQCVRCLRPFKQRLEIPKWLCQFSLDGADSVPVTGDCVDLTPSVREDILLEIPQHPLCDPECKGLPGKYLGKVKQPGEPGHSTQKSSAWAELNKLKLKP